MATIEILCLFILGGSLAIRLRPGERGRTALDLGLLAAAAWIGEDSCIRLYGFYEYAPTWSVFLDRVPLLIVLIWPAVVFSARVIVTAFRPRAGPAEHAAWTALLVTVDASFVEPVATSLGLWRWTEPGIFAVPPVGILGWGFFAGSATWFLARFGASPVRFAALLAAPALTHLLLLGAWWGGLRWLSGPIPFAGAVGWALCVSCAGVALALADREGVRRIGLAEMLSRLAAAVFFFGMLFVRPLPGLELGVYAVIFAVPYTLLLGLQKRSRGSPAHLQAL